MKQCCVGGTGYGAQVSFTTLVVLPTLGSTTAASAIATTTATSGGSITTSGGGSITANGVCWATTASPTTGSSKTTDTVIQSGSFSSSLTGLAPGTLYYVRSYATNSEGTTYGAQISFTTLTTTPTVTTTAISSLTGTSASSGGSISATGGAAITTDGVCWSTVINPTITDTKTTDTTVQSGAFTSSITGLTAGTIPCAGLRHQQRGYGLWQRCLLHAHQYCDLLLHRSGADLGCTRNGPGGIYGVGRARWHIRRRKHRWSWRLCHWHIRSYGRASVLYYGRTATTFKH